MVSIWKHCFKFSILAIPFNIVIGFMYIYTLPLKNIYIFHNISNGINLKGNFIGEKK